MKIWRAAASLLLLAHAALAGAALVYLPHGFPLFHARTWLNTVIPGAVLISSAVALLTRKSALGAVATLSLSGLWLSASLTGLALFCVSAPRFVPLLFAVGGILLVVGCVLLRAAWSSRAPVALGVGALIGAAWMMRQRAELPKTRPLGGTLHEVAEGVEPLAAEVEPADGAIQVRCGPLRLEVYPLLTFLSRSPDGFWTVFAPADGFGPRRALVSANQRPEGALLRYADDGESTLEYRREGARTFLDARSKLASPVYSHLNHFTAFRVSGTHALSVRTSATGAHAVEVLPSDYPTGRPLRFAHYVEDRLAVVQASSGEKGPFQTLAEGRLARKEPLVLTLLADGREVCAVTLKDFAAQASPQRSPTAGWGVGVAAVQFLRGHQGQYAFFLSLASTGPGRGFESVGHAPGVYRNRILIEPL